MNILFFLTPKSDVAYIFEDETLRQTVEKMEHRKFSCIPILNKEGQYTGTISEGADADMEDLLDRAINQNYVPVIDDKGSFIGIITRKEIIKYCYKEMKKLSALHEK